MPCARSSVPRGNRGTCCANATCGLCPSNAKFTIFNGLDGTYEDPRVELRLRAEVIGLDAEAGQVRRVRYLENGLLREVRSGMVVLGANAIFSAAILLRSRLGDAATGRYLHEQLGAEVEVLLDGLDNFDGGTFVTGINYALFDGPHRREASGVHLLFRNHPQQGLRIEQERWRQTLPLLLIAESLPDAADRVTVEDQDLRPVVSHGGMSDYARRGIERALRELPALLRPLPVERIVVHGYRPNEAHVQGTLRMGRDPRDSVVDADLVHHRLRNLIVMGTSVMPGCGTANPSLTAAALSLRAAERLL